MRKAQVLLREDQKAALQRLSRRTGRSQSELVRHGVDLAIADVEKTSPSEKAADTKAESDDWKKAWLGIVGLWADRDDIDERRAQLRTENQHRDAELQRQWRAK